MQNVEKSFEKETAKLKLIMKAILQYWLTSLLSKNALNFIFKFVEI